ncbi:ATP-binding protein [Paenibacillus thermotolerans]|uniref:AAA family ATPase n=1 Tax=Paenibacillus thermotolerans TaxID=3027807 RepID=UPI003082563C
MFFLQMSGFPGSGKSTLAKEIARRTKAVIIDHDVVKTGLLEGMDNDIDPKRAGGVAYHIEWSLIDFHLSQGHSVILDSPCLYEEMVENGTAIAEKHNVKYKYVECVLNDIHELNNRLKNRERLITQIDQVHIPEEHWQEVINRAKRPAHLECINVNTSQTLDYYLGDVLKSAAIIGGFFDGFHCSRRSSHPPAVIKDTTDVISPFLPAANPLTDTTDAKPRFLALIPAFSRK